MQFLGPGVLCLLIGSLPLLRFYSARWLISPQWIFFVIMILVLPAIIRGFSMPVLHKVFRSTKREPSVLEFIGEVAITIDEASPNREGLLDFVASIGKPVYILLSNRPKVRSLAQTICRRCC